MRRSILLVVALGVACARSRGAGDAPARAAEPCAVPVPESHGTWRQVQAEGFTFCVPTSWNPSSPPAGGGVERQRFYFNGGEMTWSTPKTRVGGARRITTTTRPRIAEWTETISGQKAEFQTVEWTELRLVSARWPGSRVTLSGEVRSLGDAELLKAVYRTVRFPGE
jgi:hypothetical protein